MKWCNVKDWFVAGFLCVSAVPATWGSNDSGSYCLEQVDSFSWSEETVSVHLRRETCGCEFDLVFEEKVAEKFPPRVFSTLVGTQQAFGLCKSMYEIEIRDALPRGIDGLIDIVILNFPDAPLEMHIAPNKG